MLVRKLKITVGLVCDDVVKGGEDKLNVSQP